MVNYKSPYSEYFKEIADFTQNSIDYFNGKKKEKKSHFFSQNSQTITEENENENFSKTPQQKIGDYQIFINNINYQRKMEEQIADTINYKKKDDRRFAFLDKIYNKKDLKIFINNINYKEITKEKISSVENNSRPNIAKIEKNKKNNLESKNKGKFVNGFSILILTHRKKHGELF